jgi:hypothetical protein
MKKIQMSLFRGDSSEESDSKWAAIHGARTKTAIGDAVINNANAMLADRSSHRFRREFGTSQSRGAGAP